VQSQQVVQAIQPQWMTTTSTAAAVASNNMAAAESATSIGTTMMNAETEVTAHDPFLPQGTNQQQPPAGRGLGGKCARHTALLALGTQRKIEFWSAMPPRA
jgi:hypothetical protein